MVVNVTDHIGKCYFDEMRQIITLKFVVRNIECALTSLHKMYRKRLVSDISVSYTFL